MRVIVTGGAGFIGSHLISKLEQLGAEVIVLDDFSSGRKENLAGFKGRIVNASILDEDSLRKAVKGCELVFHLAAYVSAPRSMEEPTACIDLNVKGTAAVVQAASEAGCKKIFFASSAAVYGDGEDKAKREDSDLRPNSPYAVSKLAGEQLLTILGNTYNVKTVAFRFFNVFGCLLYTSPSPRDQRGSRMPSSA